MAFQFNWYNLTLDVIEMSIKVNDILVGCYS